MVKGVNKRVVEINNPSSEYFERAILFISKEKLETAPEELSAEATRYLRELGLKQILPSYRRRQILVGAVAAGTLILGILAYLLFWL